MKLFRELSNSDRVIVGIHLVIAYEWLMGGVEKVQSGKFPESLSGVFAKFAGQNPYGWYKTFLEGLASQNAALLGNLVMWGEVLVGVGLVVSLALSIWAKSKSTKIWAAIVAIVSLVGGVIMNANFYFAAGWTSPSTSGINVIMFWVQLLLAYGWFMAWKTKR